MTPDLIRLQIRELQKDLARNTFELRRLKYRPNTTRTLELLMARQTIYQSIAHRQGLLIEFLENSNRFKESA